MPPLRTYSSSRAWLQGGRSFAGWRRDPERHLLLLAGGGGRVPRRSPPAEAAAPHQPPGALVVRVRGDHGKGAQLVQLVGGAWSISTAPEKPCCAGRGANTARKTARVRNLGSMSSLFYSNMMSALKLGVRISLDEIKTEEFYAMLIADNERDQAERERMSGRAGSRS